MDARSSPCGTLIVVRIDLLTIRRVWVTIFFDVLPIRHLINFDGNRKVVNKVIPPTIDAQMLLNKNNDQNRWNQSRQTNFPI